MQISVFSSQYDKNNKVVIFCNWCKSHVFAVPHIRRGLGSSPRPSEAAVDPHIWVLYLRTGLLVKMYLSSSDPYLWCFVSFL